MDEVDAMARAGESVGKAVRAVRRSAVRAGHAGAASAVQLAERAEGKLVEHGVTADYLRGVVADRAGALVEKAEEVEKSTRKTRKQLAKRAKGVRKDVVKAAERARKEARTRSKDVRKAAKQARKDFAASQKPQSRRWPWVLALFVAGAVAGYVALTRRPQEVHLEEEEFVEPTTATTPKSTATSRDTAASKDTTSEDEAPEPAHAARNGRVSDRS